MDFYRLSNIPQGDNKETRKWITQSPTTLRRIRAVMTPRRPSRSTNPPIRLNIIHPQSSVSHARGSLNHLGLSDVRAVNESTTAVARCEPVKQAHYPVEGNHDRFATEEGVITQIIEEFPNGSVRHGLEKLLRAFLQRTALFFAPNTSGRSEHPPAILTKPVHHAKLESFTSTSSKALSFATSCCK